MPYATVDQLAQAATGGWGELAARACPTHPGLDAALVQAVASGGDTVAWPADDVAVAQQGVQRLTDVLDMASRHADTYLYPRYRQQMPLPPDVVASSPLPDVVAALALRRLFGAEVPEGIAKGTKWADDYLRDLSKGVVSLGAMDTAVATPAGRTQVRTPPKAFDWGAY